MEKSKTVSPEGNDLCYLEECLLESFSKIVFCLGTVADGLLVLVGL